MVGAPRRRRRPASSGSVYVFLTSDGGATYGQVAKLTAAAAAADGSSVDIDGDTIVVGQAGTRTRRSPRLSLDRRRSRAGQADGRRCRLAIEFGKSVAIARDDVVVA